MLDRITGLQVFARVAALGSLTAAARALGMSQTMATKHIAALEARLGIKLLHRTTRRLTLTEAGRSYLEAVERILGDLAEADAAAARETMEVSGTLRLNAPVSFGIREIAPLIPEFLRLHPQLEIDVGFNDRHVDLIEEGWDLVIRIGALTDKSLIARRLAPCRVLLCASPAYLEKHGTPRTVDELKDHNCLKYTLSRMIGVDLWAFAEGKVLVPVTGSLKANNGDALVIAAIAGEGIIYAPSFMLSKAIASGLLAPLKLDHEPIEPLGVFAAYPPSRRPPAKVRAFIDFIAERFRGVPPWDRIDTMPVRECG